MITIEVELRLDRYELIAIDLFAHMLKYETFILPFKNTPAYFDQLALSINNFISGLQVSSDRI